MKTMPAAHSPSNAESVPAGTRRITMAAVFCIGCHQPAPLNEQRECKHCERDPRVGKVRGVGGLESPEGRGIFGWLGRRFAA
jgi:hypothetical protein